MAYKLQSRSSEAQVEARKTLGRLFETSPIPTDEILQHLVCRDRRGLEQASKRLARLDLRFRTSRLQLVRHKSPNRSAANYHGVTSAPAPHIQSRLRRNCCRCIADKLYPCT